MNCPRFTILTVILATTVACGTSPRVSDTDAPRLSGGSGSAEVTYRPNVHITERDAGLASLLDVSTDGSTFVFDRRQEAFATLAPGDVVLIKGLLARKVIAVETQANEIAVLTVPAGLIDVIKDGQIRVQAPVRFGAAQAAARASTGLMAWEDLTRAFLPRLIAQSPTEERRKQAERQGVKDAYGNLVKAPFKSLMSGWETTFSAVPESGRLNVSLQLKKSGAGVTALITGEGYLADFDFSSDIEIKQSVGERLQIGYKKLNALMNFKWEVGTDARVAFTGDSRIKLPAAIEIPLAQYLGGLPLFLELSSAVIIQPALTGGLEFSHGAFRITFDGYQTFRVKEGNADADGKVTGDIQLLETKNVSAVAPLGIVVAFAAPRIELSFGMSKVFKFEGFKEAAGKADKASVVGDGCASLTATDLRAGSAAARLAMVNSSRSAPGSSHGPHCGHGWCRFRASNSSRIRMSACRARRARRPSAHAAVRPERAQYSSVRESSKSGASVGNEAALFAPLVGHRWQGCGTARPRRARHGSAAPAPRPARPP